MREAWESVLVREVGEGESSVEERDDVRWGGMKSAEMKVNGEEPENERKFRKI